MKITRRSSFSGIERTREVDITPEQLAEIESGAGRLIQHVVPHLSDDDREFLLTGLTAEEWDEAMGEEDEDATEDEDSL